ncbi:glycosyltransferase family 2 protein [Ruixingdingia sedimenti]|uniref:Glycosyltransferase family 2 protein n=1 Tax=Ruixingdingia sedimenti TaxID=3073604 RepID=A0ABU1F8T8_9RHOB|nr:glycosyltransferase family 2 protein [Xinfangfangia sp. LG-4]MDR5652869.1 glycosyltransferase family 2 protein [Xinfangfangia sp. LG-4]
MMKDEGPFLLEWIAHHLAVGFTRIVVYTNDCSDGTDTMLKRLETLGLAHHRDNIIPEGLRPQPSALNYGQEEPLVQESDWLLVFDADEFLCIKYGDGTLDDLIGGITAQGANGMVVTWRIFGSGGVHHWSRDPVTEQYLMAAPPMWNKGWGVKTLFRFDPDHWKLGIHRPKMKSKWLETDFPDSVKWLNGSGLPMEDYFKFRGWRSITRTVGYDWAQMNHYAVKSIDSYAIRKFRGNVNFKKDKYNSDYWALQDRNEVRDDAMLRYSAARKRIFDALLTDPDLNRLHFAALERAESRLAEFKGTEAYEAMVADLKAASAIPISQVEAKPPQARDPEKIAALMSAVEKRASARAKEDRKAKAPAPGAPVVASPYVTGADLSADIPLQWVPSQGIDLPADPRVFTPPALEAIMAGKFDRAAVRRLPGLLPQGARLAVYGAGCGFLPLCLSRIRPDLSIWAAEADPGLRALLERVWARAGDAPGPRLELAEPAALLAAARADAVLLDDPACGPEVLGEILPDRLLLGPRLLAGQPGAAEAFATVCAARGLPDRAVVPPAGVLVFGRGLPVREKKADG